MSLWSSSQDLKSFNCSSSVALPPSTRCLRNPEHPFKYRLEDLCISVSAVDVGPLRPCFSRCPPPRCLGENTLPLPCLRLCRHYHLHLFRVPFLRNSGYPSLLFGGHPLELPPRFLSRNIYVACAFVIRPFGLPDFFQVCVHLPPPYLVCCALLASSQHPPVFWWEDQSAICQFTCEICWTVSCSPRLTLWFSRVPASTLLPRSNLLGKTTAVFLPLFYSPAPASEVHARPNLVASPWPIAFCLEASATRSPTPRK